MAKWLTQRNSTPFYPRGSVDISHETNVVKKALTSTMVNQKKMIMCGISTLWSVNRKLG